MTDGPPCPMGCGGQMIVMGQDAEHFYGICDCCDREASWPILSAGQKGDADEVPPVEAPL